MAQDFELTRKRTKLNPCLSDARSLKHCSRRSTQVAKGPDCKSVIHRFESGLCLQKTPYIAVSYRGQLFLIERLTKNSLRAITCRILLRRGIEIC